MASIQNAVQVMVDKLVADMQGEHPLSAEEQALVSNAITKLTDNSKLEQAVVAVAESHINDARDALQQVVQTSGSSLTNATQVLEQTSGTLESKSTKLDLLDAMPSALNRLEQKQAEQSTQDIKPLFALKPIDTPSTSANNRRSTSAFAVYDSSGETFLVRPSFTANANTHQARLEYVKLHANGAAVTSLFTTFVYNNAFEQNPAAKIYSYGSSALIPLASKDNGNTEYEVVYSSQDSQTTAVANYGGIFTKSAGFSTMSKPKQNLDVMDQFGIRTSTDHSYTNTAVLYDNQKHCLIVVDEDTSLIIEKYRDGNVVTSTAIANAQELQAFVDSGDFTTVKFIYNQLGNPYGISDFNHSEAAMTGAGISYFGYFGTYNGVTKMGENKYSAHYRFTAEKKLEPINFFFHASTGHWKTQNGNGTHSPDAELKVALTTTTGELLGMYSHLSKAYHVGYDPGIIGGSITCINPYSNTGILNEQYTHNHYGLGRTCRAF
ncbi:hypothetical protein CWB72_10550 [Pseudoalteromonas phenolica]|uniref:hypothetical protein n=1 Tax=Pseudoalteromonas phenolica TaxID=161398 RepID=UPI00110B45D6|nr:hypothetical protein [Pseudoalteromonas phenolica]TMN89468.1 hypothetical protein CWB72_10550 [Pseudoalteromonas phenolica]